MKSIILILFFSVQFFNCAYCQLSLSIDNFFILKKDTLVWLEEKNTLLLCPSKGKREAIFTVGKLDKKPLLADTIHFSIESRNSEKTNNVQSYIHHKNGDYMLDTMLRSQNIKNTASKCVFLSSRHCSFICKSPFSTELFLLKKTSNNIFKKKKWEFLSTQTFSVMQSRDRLSYDHGRSNPSDLSNINLMDWNKVEVETQGGKIELHTYDSDVNSFTVKVISLKNNN